MCNVTAVIEAEVKRSRKPIDPVHQTALLYLCDLLKDERYEEAPELIRVMREIGVKSALIQDVLRGVRAYALR